MEVTIDRARKQVFHQAKTEMMDILKEGWGETTPSFQDLSNKRFGKKSSLFHVLTKELDLPYHTYSRFLATFISTCRRKQPASQLLNDKDFNTERLLPLVE